MDSKKEDYVIRKRVTQTNRKNVSDRILDVRTVAFYSSRPNVTEDSRRVACERDCKKLHQLGCRRGETKKRFVNEQIQARQLPALKLKSSAFSHSALTNFLLFSELRTLISEQG